MKNTQWKENYVRGKRKGGQRWGGGGREEESKCSESIKACTEHQWLYLSVQRLAEKSERFDKLSRKPNTHTRKTISFVLPSQQWAKRPVDINQLERKRKARWHFKEREAKIKGWQGETLNNESGRAHGGYDQPSRRKTEREKKICSKRQQNKNISILKLP